MLTSLLRNALIHRGLVLLFLLPVIGYGLFLTVQMPIDVFPDLDRPRVVLMTECPGLSTRDVEALVTQPIETVLLGSAGVEAVRSQSSSGLVVTYVEFDWGVEIPRARQIVQERLASLTGLPPGVQPRMSPPTSIMGQIMHVGISSRGDRSAMDLRSLVDWVVRPRLLREKGVAEVIVLGSGRKQYQVLIDIEKLNHFGISLQEVEQALKDNNLDTSGGFTEEGTVMRPIRILGRLGPQADRVLHDLKQIPVRVHPHRNILLHQIATVREAPGVQVGEGSVDGREGLVITIVKQPHSDTRAVTERIEIALRDMKPSLPDDLLIETDLFQLKGFIDRGIHHVIEALITGAVLVVLVLFLFLLNLRATFITLTAIPLSLLVTAIVFKLISYLTGQPLSINVMTLGGIAVAMGELVDDAIVDVENILRRLRENRGLETPRPVLRVVFEASREIRSAVVFGTAVVILAFAPLFALSGVEGRLFVPLGIAYIVSILASLIVSLTVTPVLSYYLLPSRSGGTRHHDSPLVRVLKFFASYLIRLSMRFAGVLMLMTWIVAGFCFWKLTQVGKDFLPKFDEGSIQLNLMLPTGSSLLASNDAAKLIDAKLRERPEIRHFVRRTGRAELDEHAEPVSRSEYILNIAPEAQGRREELIRDLIRTLRDEVPGVEIEAEQPLAHLISHMLSGVNAMIAIKVFGDDLDTLQRLAKQIQAATNGIQGLSPPVIDPQELIDELHLTLRQEPLAFYGVSRKEVAEFLQTALRGEIVSEVLDGNRRFDLVLKLQDSQRTDYTKLKELRFELSQGRGQVKLSELVDFPDGASGPSQINRENLSRRAVIRCNTTGRDLSSAVEEMKRRIRERVKLPEGYFVDFSGQFQAQESATFSILLLGCGSIVAIFITLYLLYPSITIALQILNAIPTAFMGGVIALLVTQQSLTVASLIGFVSLGGIAVRNGILLVTHYFHLMREEKQPFSRETILRGSLERLVPVLMTALTAGIGLIPLVIGGQKPGLEILYPVATVILGGLVTSTFCEFLLHPGLFWNFSGATPQTVSSETLLGDHP
jgi:HME family heavy-metal exporter